VILPQQTVPVKQLRKEVSMQFAGLDSHVFAVLCAFLRVLAARRSNAKNAKPNCISADLCMLFKGRVKIKVSAEG
jgi:hypothetical protein